MEIQALNGSDFFPTFLPPLLRFLVELTTWAWFLLAAFKINFLYLIGFFISIILLAGFNFPGDKNQKGPVEVSGRTRIVIEILSGILGIIVAFILFERVGALLQTLLTLIAFIVDFERWAWFIGRKTIPPNSVTQIHNK